MGYKRYGGYDGMEYGINGTVGWDNVGQGVV